MALPSHKSVMLVPVLIGAPEALVRKRELRNSYQTNRDIKTWAAWFILKAITTSGQIKNWLRQSPTLQQQLQCSEGILRAHISRLRQMGLAMVDASRNLKLCSYEKAASILQIEYAGTDTIRYDYSNEEQTQSFAYSLRLKEIENAKERQLEGLLYHVNKNPELQEMLMAAMHRQGYDTETVTGEVFQRWLLAMQVRTFAEGSDIYEWIHARRADVNRSVNGIQECHAYKCKTSVSYMKKVLKKYNLATITKKIVESKARSRKHLPDGQEAYKWKKASKSTLLVLCDDISPTVNQAA